MALFLEVVLALFYPQMTLRRRRLATPSMLEASNLLPYQLRPNAVAPLIREEFNTTVRINSLGYRSDEFDKTKTERQFRVLAIGDSFTFGFGVENDETYSARLQARLRAAHPGCDVEVINAGFASGQYPDTYYLYLREIGLALEPDLVIVGFFVGNDVDHDLAGENVWTEVNEDGLPDRISRPDVSFDGNNMASKKVPLRYRYPVLRNSHLVQGLASLVSSAFSAMRPPIVFYNQWMYRPNYEKRTTERVEMVQRMFSEMQTLARERGVRFLVAMIPTREQLLPDEYPFDDPPYSGNIDIDKPQRVFAEFFVDNGIDFIDLLPLFRAAERKDQLYFRVDSHLTPNGNDVTGRILAESQMMALALSAWRADGSRCAETRDR